MRLGRGGGSFGNEDVSEEREKKKKVREIGRKRERGKRERKKRKEGRTFIEGHKTLRNIDVVYSRT